MEWHGLASDMLGGSNGDLKAHGVRVGFKLSEGALLRLATDMVLSVIRWISGWNWELDDQ
eukprot:1159621-Pelagomonas_calceolata.AAC.5